MDKDKKKWMLSFFPGVAFLGLLWIIELIKVLFEVNMTRLGILPREWHGLFGVLSAPLIHGDFKHLLSNSFPLVVLSALFFYFYPKKSIEAIIGIWLIGGLWVWVFAGNGYHIGASGVIYGMAAYLVVTGFLRKERSAMAVSLVVVFLYGSMIWGVFPIREGVSWESHLLGAMAGILMAVYHRPPRKKDDGEGAANYTFDADFTYTITTKD